MIDLVAALQLALANYTGVRASAAAGADDEKKSPIGPAPDAAAASRRGCESTRES